MFLPSPFSRKFLLGEGEHNEAGIEKHVLILICIFSFPLPQFIFLFKCKWKKHDSVYSNIVCDVASLKNIWVHFHHFLRESFVLPREAGNGFEMGKVFQFYGLNPSVMFTKPRSWKRIDFSEHRGEKSTKCFLRSLLPIYTYPGSPVQTNGVASPSVRKKHAPTHWAVFHRVEVNTLLKRTLRDTFFPLLLTSFRNMCKYFAKLSAIPA